MKKSELRNIIRSIIKENTGESIDMMVNQWNNLVDKVKQMRDYMDTKEKRLATSTGRKFIKRDKTSAEILAFNPKIQQIINNLKKDPRNKLFLGKMRDSTQGLADAIQNTLNSDRMKGYSYEVDGKTHTDSFPIEKGTMFERKKLKEIIQESLFEALTEALCAKGKAYVAKRKAAGEKHGAYLMGRAVKVCKGQIKGEAEDAAMKKSALGMAMYGKKAKMERARYKDGGPPIQEKASEVNVFGYQTQHFNICPSAYALYKKIVDENLVDDKDLVIRVAKLIDNLFYMEKLAKETPNIVNDSFVDAAQNTADLIMSAAIEKMNLEKEHGFVQGHVDIIKGLMKEAIDEDIEAKDNTEFKIKLKHLLQKHATNLEKGKKDTEFKLTLKHLLDKHTVKGGEEKSK